jgi:formiminotetrahydrofolate cyclodeaminase
MPFADTIRIYQVSGQQLMDLIEDNILRIDRPGEPNTERGFLQFSSDVRYSILLGRKRNDARIQEVTIKGIPLESQLDKEFLIAATSFVRELAGNWENCGDQLQGCHLLNINDYPYSETDYFLRREMVKYILEQGGVTHDSGAKLDGRLQVEEGFDMAITDLSVKEFVDEVSNQNHAMAGAVISNAAVTALSLGYACIKNTQRLNDDDQTFQTRLQQLKSIQEQLLDICDKDATAISVLVSLRTAGEELQGQKLLCELPARISQLSIEAAQTLQDFRTFAHEQVKDDLEMSINLLSGTAQSAMLLLDSNLRIWTDKELAEQFEPVLETIIAEITLIKPVKRIRA